MTWLLLLRLSIAPLAALAAWLGGWILILHTSWLQIRDWSPLALPLLAKLAIVAVLHQQGTWEVVVSVVRALLPPWPRPRGARL